MDGSKEKALNRRGFLSRAGMAGAAVGAGIIAGDPTRAWAQVSGAALPGTWPAKFDPTSTELEYNPRDSPRPGGKIHEFNIELSIVPQEIVPGIEFHAFAYNKTVPGPEVRVPEGDWVMANFTNNSPDLHTIHWHGMMAPNEMDGVPLGTQWPVGPGQTFRYLFRAQPSGTHYYHCHNMTPLHIQAGMYGPLIIDAKDDIVRRFFPYEREYTLCLSEIDTNMVRDQMNEMVGMMSTMDAMTKSASLMREMNGRMMGWFYDKADFVKAVKSGYVPPYMASMTGMNQPPNFNFFMINGKSYPMTDEMLIRRGENIRVRLIGAGSMPHFMHLHGHDFWHVCQDGSPLGSPVRMNTIPIFPGTTSDIIIRGTNPGYWHFHDHSDLGTTNNGQFPGGMMTMLTYEDAEAAGVTFHPMVAVSS